MKIEKGYPVSDSSSTKNRKNKEKNDYIEKIRKRFMTTEEEIKQQKRKIILGHLHKEA